MVIGSRLSSVKRNMDANRASLAAGRGSPAARFRSAAGCCGGNVEIGGIPGTQEMFDFCAAQDIMTVRADETDETHGVGRPQGLFGAAAGHAFPEDGSAGSRRAFRGICGGRDHPAAGTAGFFTHAPPLWQKAAG
jgi:hypothetical protein